MRVDTSHLVRIPVLVDMVRALSAVRDPNGVLGVILDAMRQAYGPRAIMTLSTAGLGPGEFRIAHFINFAGERLVWNESAWDDIERLPVSSGGFISDVIRDAEPKLFHDIDIADDPVLGNDVRGLRSAIAIPMYRDGEPQQWTLFFRREPNGFDGDELEQSLLRANLVGTTITQAMMAETLRQADLAIQREVDQIADIQRALLPEAMPKIPGMTLAASYATYDRAGGDYYDFIPLARGADDQPDQDSPWAFLIADASGHGPAAAVVTAMLHSVLYAYEWRTASPSEALEFLNQKLFRRRIGNSFVTAFMGIYDPGTRTLRYANAGHPPPLIKDTLREHRMRFLDDIGGRPLGIFEEIGSDEGEVTLLPGETLVLFTDGITDARSPAGEFFGHDRIMSSLVDCNGQPACVIGSVTQALRRHEAGRRPRDDQTIVAAHVIAV